MISKTTGRNTRLLLERYESAPLRWKPRRDALRRSQQVAVGVEQISQLFHAYTSVCNMLTFHADACIRVVEWQDMALA